MYTTISGSYENGRVVLHEIPPFEKTMKVLITFVDESVEIPNATTIDAMKAVDQGEFEPVTLEGLREQWDALKN